MLIVQVSDPHLRAEGQLYQGRVDSNAMFAAAVHQIGTLDPAPDLVLLSGDVTDEGTADEYATARRLLAGLAAPLVVIPGNHDERSAFRMAFADHAYLPGEGPMNFVAYHHGPCRIIGFDVTQPGYHHGDVDEAALAWLDAALGSDARRPTLIMMHQPPFRCGLPYVDDYLCRGGERIDAVVSRYPAVERVLCGHVHRMMQVRFGGTLLCTAPSTTTAIALRLRANAEPASYIEPPGFLLHQWRPDIGVVTHLVPIGSFPGPLPFA